DGWSFRPKANRWLEIAGMASEWTPVTLPHDAMLTAPRSADATAATGYYHGGVWDYRRTLELTEADLAGTLALEFEGVYRDAKVTLNGTPVAHRPYGYSQFHVPIDHVARV